VEEWWLPIVISMEVTYHEPGCFLRSINALHFTKSGEFIHQFIPYVSGDSSLNLLIFECTHCSLSLLAGDPNAGLRTRLSRSDNSLRPAELNSS